MSRQEVENGLIQLLFDLSDELHGIEGASRNDLWPIHPDSPVREGYEGARVLMDKVFSIVTEHNGEILAEDTILSRLLYGVSAIRLEMNISDDELEEIAIRKITELLDYEGHRDVDVPLVSLETGDDPYQFGPVRIIPITSEDKETDWWLRVKSSLGDSIDNVFRSFARVNVPGDAHTAVDNALHNVNEAIRILRGVGFPITSSEVNQIGVLNEFPGWRNIPFRLGTPLEKTRVDPQPPQVTSIGPMRIPYHLHDDLLSGIDQTRLERLLQLIDHEGFNARGKMQTKLIAGWSWLGEATKPDTASARFAKTTFALESFIGGEANEELLTTRGLTATLAERGAFLVSDELDGRIEVDRRVRSYYAKRSAIVHGRGSEIANEDLVGFGSLVRQIGWSLLDRIDQFDSVDDLQSWVKTEKYR